MQKKKQFRFVFTLPGAPRRLNEAVARTSWSKAVWRLAGELARSQSDRKSLESNEAHAKKRASDFSRGTKTNRTQSLEGCFLRLPQKALRVYAKAHAGGH